MAVPGDAHTTVRPSKTVVTLQDEEYVGALAQGCAQFYWTEDGSNWMLEWADKLIHTGNANKIWSISWTS